MQETKRVYSDDPTVETIHHDADPRFAPFRNAGSKPDFLSDESMPLFLSAPSEASEQHDDESGWGTDSRKAVLSPRLLKTGILATTAAAIVVTLFSVDATRAVIVNAKASFAGTQLPQEVTADQPPAPEAQTTGSGRASPAAAPLPSREEIAVAFQTALQGRPEVRQPVALAPPARRLEADELAALLKRAKGLIAIGDIVSARLLLERAADAREAGAALLLAQTYDPAVLGTPDTRSITPDPATARGWYQKAASFGSPDAQQRLDQMQK